MQHEMQLENYKPTSTRDSSGFVGGFESHPLREYKSTQIGQRWLRCVLFLFPVVSKYLPQQMKNLRNWVHMQHECNTPPPR